MGCPADFPFKQFLEIYFTISKLNKMVNAGLTKKTKNPPSWCKVYVRTRLDIIYNVYSVPNDYCGCCLFPCRGGSMRFRPSFRHPCPSKITNGIKTQRSPSETLFILYILIYTSSSCSENISDMPMYANKWRNNLPKVYSDKHSPKKKALGNTHRNLRNLPL